MNDRRTQGADRGARVPPEASPGAALAAVLDEAVAGGLGSAAAVSVGDASGERLRHCCGALWRVPTPGPAVDEAAWFDLASLTKPMVTAALAMVLVDRGRLALDEPVRRWLPDAATPGTVAELLGHAAGCAAHVKFFEEPEVLALAAEPRRARQQILRRARTHPLVGVPGKDTLYSDLGYMMLGELLERAAGDELARLHAELVAGPLTLGAHFRGAAGAAKVPPGAVVATELDAAGQPLRGEVHDENARIGGGVFGHAGLFGRVGDVAAFARAVLALPDGGGLVRPETAAAFFARSLGGGSWRLGWDTPSSTPGVSHAGDRWPRHGGVGHLGFTGTSLWLDLPRRRWVALLTNRVHPTREGTADDIKRLRRRVMDEATALLDGAAAPSAER
jgi:CubicO group peptidase (beta-lactamase class C family)